MTSQPALGTVIASCRDVTVVYGESDASVRALDGVSLEIESTESAPNSVTGKRLRLVVDRYYLWHAGRRAVVDLGTPEGVDNVDAYRLMIESFRWS